MNCHNNDRGLTRGRLLLCVAPAAMLSVLEPALSAPLDVQGETGVTSYTTLPFQTSVFGTSWGASAGLSPANLFWQSGTHFTNANTMTAARQTAASMTAQGVVPAGGSQRWEDTYEASQPSSLFPGEPSWVQNDRQGDCCSTPEFQAWVAWMRARPTLAIMANDGGSFPVYMRQWSASYGHVSPLMPLAAGDCPPGMTACTYADWYAYRWGQTAALSGAYGIMLSDFSDSQPSDLSSAVGYNPAIVKNFAAAEHVVVPSGSTASQSAWIAAHAINAWNDYLSMGYGHFYAALAARLTSATGQQALVIDQCSLWPSLRRAYGTDERIFANLVSPKSYVCEWDDQSMQVGRGGQDPVWGVGAYAIAAAREPNERNGANLEANDSAYWAAIANFNPTLSAADQQEKGLKLLKRSWLEASWAHIATRTGTVRRALAFMSRDYWDVGTLDPTLQKLISSIVPTRPFGFAVYYSTTAERAVEQRVVANASAQSYYNPAELLTIKNAGVPVDYFVSDAGLSYLTAAAKPAAWVVLEHPELIPAAEMSALKWVAPVLTSVAQVRSFSNAPLSFSAGLTGTGFYDQNNRLIVTVTNPASTSVSGTVTLNGLADGTYTALDLFGGGTCQLTVVSGRVSAPITVQRWDTQAFAISPG